MTPWFSDKCQLPSPEASSGMEQGGGGAPGGAGSRMGGGEPGLPSHSQGPARGSFDPVWAAFVAGCRNLGRRSSGPKSSQPLYFGALWIIICAPWTRGFLGTQNLDGGVLGAPRGMGRAIF